MQPHPPRRALLRATTLPAAFALRSGATGLALATGAFSQTASAQSSGFPSKPITIIVPAAPGGILDQCSRLIAGELTKAVGQPVIVENKAGASQIIGMNALARAEPDGHTLAMGSIGPNAAHYSVYPKLPYTPADITPVVHVVSTPNVLLVNPNVQARTVPELVALAKAKPGSLVLASSGTATSGHLAGELLKMRAGIDLTHVPYKGATPALTDLIGGQVQVMVDNLVTALPQIRAGRLRALGVTSGKRLAELPDVPTIAEQGYPGFEVQVWVGLVAPGRTPSPIVQTLHREVSAVLALPAVRQRLHEMGGSPEAWSQAQFSDYVRAETDKWAAVVKQAGIKAD
jgi:tripartite-type tricarboxylate transporter receptor subunit TctC